MGKTLLFTLSKDAGDFIVETFRCGGHGGQNVNKVETGVRIKHPASGAIAECREERYQLANRKKAFKKLIQSKTFQTWHKLKVGYALRNIQDMERELQRKIDEAMNETNLKIEVFDSKLQKWVEVKSNE